MSCLTLFPYGQTLDYWWEALRGEPARLAFLFTKAVEMHAFRHNFRRNRQRGYPPAAPSFSRRGDGNGVGPDAQVAVVVPAFVYTAEHATMLAALCKALTGQTRAHRLIVVDDGSPQPIHLPDPVKVHRLEGNRGPAAARNRGIALAIADGAEIIALTDSDCRPQPGWLEALVAAFLENPQAHLLSGMTQSRDRCWLGRYHDRNGTLNGRRLTEGGGLLYGPTCNMAGCRAVFEALRFDEAFPSAAAEDIEFCYRANRLGYRIAHCANAVVEHDFGYDQLPPHRAWARFYRQFRRYADGEPLLLERHPDYLAAFTGSVEIPVARAHSEPSLTARAAEGATA